MRIPSPRPLLTLALVAGCAAESPRPSSQETAFRGVEEPADLDRDLTLQTRSVPAVEVASAVELSRPAPESPRRARPAPRPAAAPASMPEHSPETPPAADPPVAEPPVAEPPTAVSSETVAEAVVDESPDEEAALGAGQELAPGKTVTVIPASSGPSSAPAEPSWAPTGPGRSVIIEGGGRGGGKCRPRGGVRGIGIAGRIPHGVPGLRLR